MKQRLSQHLQRLTPIDILVAGFCAIMIFIVSLRIGRNGTGAARYILNYAAVLAAALVAAPALDSVNHPLVRNPFMQFIRHVYPMFLLGPFYQWTCPISRMFFPSPFDELLLRADISLFGYNIARDLVHRWGDNYWLKEWFNFSYLSYYWVALYLPLYLYAKKRYMEFFSVMFIGGVTIYACFIFQAVFPAMGPINFDPVATGYLKAGPISAFAREFLLVVDIPGGAMPSGHIAGAVAILLLAWRHARAAFWPTMPIVISLCIATVYCRYHYAVDGIAGVLVALGGVYVAGPRLYRWLFPRTAPDECRESGGITAPVFRPDAGHQ